MLQVLRRAEVSPDPNLEKRTSLDVCRQTGQKTEEETKEFSDLDLSTNVADARCITAYFQIACLRNTINIHFEYDVKPVFTLSLWIHDESMLQCCHKVISGDCLCSVLFGCVDL